MKLASTGLFLGLAWVLIMPSAQANLPDFTELVEAAAPAVVNITATRKAVEQSAPSQEEMPTATRYSSRNLSRTSQPATHAPR